MPVRVGINGLGRIGRHVLRCALDQAGSKVEVVAVNDLAPTATLAHLLRYDSTHGPLDLPVRVHEGKGESAATIAAGPHLIHVTKIADPARIPWAALNADIVIEATGRFRTREAAAAHLDAGAGKVVITAPAKNADATIVMGINDDVYDPENHHIVSNASCTTHCLAPMVSVLHRAFGLRRGLVTTMHSYTNDQSLLDGPHQDLRRARSAAVNLIPTGTGAARTLGEVIPELAGKLDGIAVRVPLEDGSLTDLSATLDMPVTSGQVNRAFADAAAGCLKPVLRYTEDPIVSRDIIGNPASCVFDASLTRAEDDLVKIFGWYDNEWGYAHRTLDLVELIASYQL
ncbi:type I glyceraldehyde-3-phosphate dehydrogenase [Amycolatopsis cynarae]|uniref:Glyceraldehyde-3-phosphate dehydrogenase n=1 Tax=Amycolatopsis cynarae TaxID=2995223 RepID=A0ABY7B996_9PSEU|nr:type I glyceraldehyde-3-phosphate dehydrogenase [Amycolatopsis sp. HUAS 11-8]WAL68942.1 type I glyceraldehyde-3-phosphate dehydrogenase [Amycolatopsis sp. HUAS 11-8]